MYNTVSVEFVICWCRIRVMTIISNDVITAESPQRDYHLRAPALPQKDRCLYVYLKDVEF